MRYTTKLREAMVSAEFWSLIVSKGTVLRSVCCHFCSASAEEILSSFPHPVPSKGRCVMRLSLPLLSLSITVIYRCIRFEGIYKFYEGRSRSGIHKFTTSEIASLELCNLT